MLTGVAVLSALACKADALARAAWLPSRLRAARDRPVAGYGHLALAGAVVRVRVEGRGPRTLVFVPDPPNVLEHHSAAFTALAGERRVVGFELPGFGLSLARPGYDFDLARTRDVVVDLLTTLDLTRVTLAFSCVAGLLALAVARAAPTRVERVITVQTAGLEATRRWARRVDPGPGVLATPFVGQLATAVAPRAIARRWYRAAFREPVDAARASALADDAFARGSSFSLASGLQALHRVDPRILRGVTQPVTAIFGERDRTHRRTPPDSILELVPHAQVVPFARSSHFPDLEEFDRFARVVAEM